MKPTDLRGSDIDRRRVNPIVFNKDLIDREEGHLRAVRCVASSRNGRWSAVGDLDGTVVVSEGDAELYSQDVRPLNYKANADRFLHTMAFSRTGDILICCSGVDVVALNSITGTVAWEFHPNRQFGFLRTVPLGLAVTDDDHILVSCTNGQFVRLDRKGRIVAEAIVNESPQSMVSVARTGFVVGTDGFHLVAWDEESLVGRWSYPTQGRFFAVSAAGSVPRVAVRVPGAIKVLEMVGFTELAELEVGPGLPVTAMNPEGTLVGYLENGVPSIVEVETGLAHHYRDFVPKATTVAWHYGEARFCFGFADGSVEYLDPSA